MTDNPTTTGMDGADRDEWHAPDRDVTGRMLAAIAGTAAVVLLLAALVYVIYATYGVTVTLSIWVIVALTFAAGGVGLMLGVALMAAMAMAGRADDRMERGA